MATIRIFRHYVLLPFLLLGILEFAIFAFSVYAGAWLRFSGDHEAAFASIGCRFFLRDNGQVQTLPASTGHSHSMVPGGLPVMS